MSDDGRGSGCSVGEGKECLQTEWPTHHVSAGCGHWVSFGIFSEDAAPHRAGQSISSPLPSVTSQKLLLPCAVSTNFLPFLYMFTQTQGHTSMLTTGGFCSTSL